MTSWKKVGDAVLRELEERELSESATVVLVGSAARDAVTWRSDVDILLLLKDGTRLRIWEPILHLQQETRAQFLEHLRVGDDYPAWALRHGLLLHDPDGWWDRQVGAYNARPLWPDWTRKLGHAQKRMTMAEALLDTGDFDATTEELLYAASHIARATLLRDGLFPLSRPEIPDQLQVTDPELATTLRRLNDGDLGLAALRTMTRPLRTRLARLVRQSEEVQPIAMGDLTIRPASKEVFLGLTRLDLSPTEFKLLYLLATNDGLTLTEEDASREVWPTLNKAAPAFKKYVQRLRLKLGDDARHPEWIKTERGIGYRFSAPASSTHDMLEGAPPR